MSSMATPPRPNFNLNNVIAPDIGGSLIDFANQQSKQFQLGLSNVMAEAQARRAEEQAIRANEQAEREKINFDRLNKDREALINFNKGMLQPQVISGIVTDTIRPEQVEKMSFTPEELAQYNAVGGDINKLSGSARTKAELQTKLSNFADTLPSSPEFQESNYQQAQRVASGLDLTPGIIEELKKYQVADVLAQKENKKEGATYLGEAKELESKIAELKTKQGSILDKQAGVGKEWGKTGSGSGNKMLDSSKMLQYSEMVKNTDSAEELQNMIKEVFINPNIPEKQKESIAANIVLSSGAKLPQGLTDFGKLNVSVEDAQKATTEYLANLQNGVYGNPNGPVAGTPKEIGGLADEIALLEARRNSALAKANSYSNGDRTSSARELMSSRLGSVFGDNVLDTGDKSTPLTIRTNNPGAVKNASRTDKNAMWEGQTGFDEQGHAVFSSPEYGARAMAKNLQSQIEKGRTLNTLLQEYATGNQDAYIKNVSAKTGIDPNQKLTEGDIRKLMGAMVEHEAGVKNPFSAEVLDKGYELALGKLPNSTSPESKEFDIKALFDNVKYNKNKKESDEEINKLATLYKELGGKGGIFSSAGPIDDVRINREAYDLSKKFNIPAQQIMDKVKFLAEQEIETINKLKNDPEVKLEYDRAWKEASKRIGDLSTTARPFTIEDFIQSVYINK